jgi:hypothetical protein
MINEFRRPVIDVVAGVLMGTGLLFVFLGWFGLRDQQSVVEQIPYIASGGIGGLALLGAGAALLHLTRQARLEQRMQDVIARQEALELAVQAIAVSLRSDVDISDALAAVAGRSRSTTNGMPSLRDPVAEGVRS